MGEGNNFTLCVSPHFDGGGQVPQPGLNGGGVYLIPGLRWGVPHPRSEVGGTPSQVWSGGYPGQVWMVGGTLAKSGWWGGYSIPGLRWGVPHLRSGCTLTRSGWWGVPGVPPRPGYACNGDVQFGLPKLVARLLEI